MSVSSSTQPRNHYRMWSHNKMAVQRLIVSSGEDPAEVDPTAFVWTGSTGGGAAVDPRVLDVTGSLWGLWIVVNGATETIAGGDVNSGVVKVRIANLATLDETPVAIGPNMPAGTDSYFEGWTMSTPLTFEHVDGDDDIEVLVYALFDSVDP